MTDDIELMIGTKLDKKTGTIAGNAEWTVIDTLEGFGGEVVEVTVESSSEYDRYDGRQKSVSVKDIGHEWELVD